MSSRRLVLTLLGVMLSAMSPFAMVSARGQGAPAPVTIRTKHFEIVARDKAVAQRKGKVMELAAERFKKLFGEYAPFGRVTLLRAGMPGTGVSGSYTPTAPTPGTDAPQWTLPWYDPPKHQRPNDPDLMTHEAGHMMFNTWLEPKLSAKARARTDRYGSKLPDWWDEGIAVYLEPQYMRGVRRKQIRAAIGRYIRFTEFFAAEHPLAEELNRPGGVKPQDYKRKQAILIQYYGQTMSVIEFMMASGGKAFILAVNSELAAGETIEAALAKCAKPRSLKTVRGFEQAWVRYVRKTYR